MSKFSDWEFLLDGNVQEFRCRSERRGSFYFNVYGGVDDWLDCKNNDFRMTTYYCEGEVDPKLVWQVGHELVSLFNGASILFDKEYHKASIFSLLYQGQKTNPMDYSPAANSVAMLGRPEGFNRYQIDEEVKSARQSCNKLYLMHLATENKDVYFILKYLDMPEGWVTYYKLMEALETFGKEKEVDLEVVQSERKMFTNTANNFSLSGFDSRHGFKAIVKRNRTTSMSLEDAHSFITSMAKTYLNKVYFS